MIGVSFALHAGALGYLASRPPPPPPAVDSHAIEMEFFTPPEPTPPAPQPEVAPPPKLAAITPPKKKTNDTTPPPSSTVQPSTQEGGPTATGPSVGPRGDLPLAVAPSLTPSTGFIMQLGPAGTNDSGRGSTVRNGPGETPDQAALNEYTGEVLTRKLNSDLREQVGQAATDVGNVPTHFKRYEQMMRKALPTAKLDRTPWTAQQAITDVAGIMFNNGPSAEAQKKIADLPTGRSIQNQNVMMPNVDDQRMREASMQTLAQMENVKERIRRARLTTVLEMTTDATGVLADVSIVEKSGDPRFDESVLHFSRKVARTIPDADDKLLGTSMWRTRWQFTWEPPEVKVKLLNAWRVE
ncbi:MAG: energy transducer TonB [Myxococcaceae bacterium]